MKRISVISILTVAMSILLWCLWARQGARPDDKVHSDIGGELRQQNEPNGNKTEASSETRKAGEPAQLDRIRGIANLANRPIEFYGLVVDQDNTPINGAKVTLQIRAMKEATPGVIADLFDDIVVSSDSNGRFALTGTKGSVLTVKALEKKGYDPSRKSTNRSFRYWDNEEVRYKSYAGRPEVFRMWKKSGAEPLEHGNKFYGIVPDGRSYSIDLLQHKKTEGGNAGDLKVSIQRPSEIEVGKKYNWSCIVEGIGGGVIESDTEQMYLAPESGYKQRYEIKILALDSQWTEKEERQFYLKSRDGRVYARLEVEVLANYQDKAIFSVEYYANPSGSRNLEYDSLQGIAKP